MPLPCTRIVAIVRTALAAILLLGALPIAMAAAVLGGTGESGAQLVDAQKTLLTTLLPGYQVLAACKGNFSGQADDELVLAVAGPGSGPAARIGLVRSGGQWTLHRIDDELRQDAALSHASPIDEWLPAAAVAIRPGVKCNVPIDKDQDLSINGKPLGRSPFFSVPKVGTGARAHACFATSEQYNNWDCVAFDPRQRRFRLWYQQVFAD